MPVKNTTITRDEIDAMFNRRTSDVRDLPILKQEGQTMAGREGKRSQAESERLIREYIYQAKKPVTFTQICGYLDRRPAEHLRKMVDAMVKSGEVKREHDFEAGPSIPRFLYSVNKR